MAMGREAAPAYAWYRRALAGDKPPIHSEPECGFFFLKSGPGNMLPVSIFWDGPRDDAGELIGDETLKAEVAGAERDPYDVWPACAKRVISKDEYLARLFELLTGEQQEKPF